MNEAVQIDPATTEETVANDRLMYMFVASCIIHTVIILTVGVSIAFSQEEALPPPMEIVLVQTKSENAPDEAEFIANENKDGGGNTDDPDPQSSPFKAPFENQEANLVTPQPGSMSKRDPTPEDLELLTAAAGKKVNNRDVEQQKKNQNRNNTNIEKLSIQLESQSAAVDNLLNAHAKRPKTEYISVRTKKHDHAAYMKHWEARVERIGNEKYPKSVKGEVLLVVTIYKNGTLKSFDIRRIKPMGSTRHSVLQDAAKRLIKKSAPYKPFPPSIKGDFINITSTFIFRGERVSAIAQ